MGQADEIVEYLAKLPRRVAQGDILAMFAALYNKLQMPMLEQKRDDRPERTRVIQKILTEEYGIPGLPVWGSSAIRGNLNDDKEHIKLFIDLVNGLAPEDVADAWKAATAWYRHAREGDRRPIRLNPGGGMVSAIRSLIIHHSVGMVQQGLCYAASKVFYGCVGPEYGVMSKRTWAGDAQSQKIGDVDIRRRGELTFVLEIKAHVVDQNKLAEVLAVHGEHPYTLCVIAAGFTKGIDERKNLVCVCIRDFIETLIVSAASLSCKTPEEVAALVLREYNTFMVEVENRPELTVELKLEEF